MGTGEGLELAPRFQPVPGLIEKAVEHLAQRLGVGRVEHARDRRLPDETGEASQKRSPPMVDGLTDGTIKS